MWQKYPQPNQASAPHPSASLTRADWILQQYVGNKETIKGKFFIFITLFFDLLLSFFSPLEEKNRLNRRVERKKAPHPPSLLPYRILGRDNVAVVGLFGGIANITRVRPLLEPPSGRCVAALYPAEWVIYRG